MPATVIVAHRGLSALYPENTLLAIEQAVAAGARAVEFDVQLTADRIPVLFHDLTLERLTGQPGRITDVTWRQLQNYNAAFPARYGDLYRETPISTLEQITDYFSSLPRVLPCIEIKQESLAHYGLATCMKTILKATEAVSKDALYLSFSRVAIEFLHAHGIKRTGWVLAEYNNTQRDIAEHLQPQVLICDIRQLPETGEIFWPGNYKWMVYQTEDMEVVKKFSGLGVEYIETDNVKAVADSLPELFL